MHGTHGKGAHNVFSSDINKETYKTWETSPKKLDTYTRYHNMAIVHMPFLCPSNKLCAFFKFCFFKQNYTIVSITNSISVYKAYDDTI